MTIKVKVVPGAIPIISNFGGTTSTPITIEINQELTPNITIKQAFGTLQATNPVLVVAKIGSTDRFDQLADVIEGSSPEEGAVAVYNPTNDKYEVKKLDFDDLVGDIDDVDGGQF